MIILRIKAKEFEAIKNGTKKNEWRTPSLFNKRILLKKNKDGLFCENTELTEILFINGYSKNSPQLKIHTSLIRPVKFNQTIEIKEDNFIGRINECAIQIRIDKIID